MTYNIGDRSLIFKNISLFLQENYLSTLKVSDEYNLDLAKCIYSYLQDYYPIIYSDYFRLDHSIAEIYLLGYKTGATSLDTSEYANPYFPGVRLRKQLGVVPNDTPDYQIIYSEVKSEKTDTVSIRDYVNNVINTAKERKKLDSLNMQEVYLNAIDTINKYNIWSWPINETIMQFLSPEIVISESSTEDEIAQFQLLAEKVGYLNYTAGLIDPEFIYICYNIQKEQNKIDPKIIPTGYCDIYVEKYLRAKNEVRIEVYR